MQRRTLLKALVASAFASGGASAAPPANMKGIEDLQKDGKTCLPAGAGGPAPGDPLKLSKDGGRKRLPADAFRVLREEGTERAGTSALNEEKRAGVFVCAGCGLPLFTSEMKYESGTGWPSFFTSIPGAFETKKDYFLIYPRTEYHCIRCGGHHGPLFHHGPPPTGPRRCNNGVALRFLPRQSA